jgi:hypothetical protein
MIDKSVKKALYVLAMEKLEYTYPQAVKREEAMKKFFNEFDEYNPTRVTYILNDAINMVYSDAFKLEAEANQINNFMLSYEGKEIKFMESVIDKKLSKYAKIMGAKPSHSTSDEIPF